MQLWQFFVRKYSRTSPLKCAHILRRQYIENAWKRYRVHIVLLANFIVIYDLNKEHLQHKIKLANNKSWPSIFRKYV